MLQVTIDRHPVRFFVHKRPHVDYFLEIVSLTMMLDWGGGGGGGGGGM